MKQQSPSTLTSPEQLDQFLVVIRLRGWIVLGCVSLIVVAMLMWALFGSLTTSFSGNGIFFDPESIELVQSESEGTIDSILVAERVQVEAKTPLLSLRNKGAQEIIHAQKAGEVLQFEVLPGEVVSPGTTLLWFKKAGGEDLIYGFFSLEEGSQILPGMQAYIAFDSVKTELYGKMKGRVESVLPFAASMQSDLLRSIPSQELREYLESKTASMIVVVKPELAPSTPSGYSWTTENGPPHALPFGSIAQVKVVLERKAPISYLFPIGAK